MRARPHGGVGARSGQAVAAALLAAAMAGCAAPGGSAGPAPQVAATPARAPTQAAAPVPAPAAPLDPAEVADGSPLAAPDGSERLAYTGPVGPAGTAADQRIDQPPGRAVGQVREALRKAGLRIGQVDERAGLVVATYAGDPARFADCGTIVARTDGGGARRLDAAAESAAFRRARDRRPLLVERGMALRARLVLQLRPDGQGTRLTGRATYVVTKRTAPAGGPPRFETISFQSGGRAGFAKGTICQPTGALERVALVPATAAAGV